MKTLTVLSLGELWEDLLELWTAEAAEYSELSDCFVGVRKTRTLREMLTEAKTLSGPFAILYLNQESLEVKPLLSETIDIG